MEPHSAGPAPGDRRCPPHPAQEALFRKTGVRAVEAKAKLRQRLDELQREPADLGRSAQGWSTASTLITAAPEFGQTP